MIKPKLTDSRINILGSEYATILNVHYIEEENYMNWKSNDYVVFMNKNYDDFVQVALDEGLIESSERKYFKTYTDDIHDKIKKVAIDVIKVLIKER